MYHNSCPIHFRLLMGAQDYVNKRNNDLITNQTEKSHYEAEEVLRRHVINLSVLAPEFFGIPLDGFMDEYGVRNDFVPIEFRYLLEGQRT